MLVFLPLAHAADTTQADPKIFDDFVIHLRSQQKLYEFPTFMTPKWQKFMPAEMPVAQAEEVRCAGDDTNDSFWDGVDAEFLDHLSILQNFNMQFGDGLDCVATKIGNFLKKQVVKIKHALEHKKRASRLPHLQKYVRTLLQNAVSFPKLVARICMRAKVEWYQVCDLAFLVGLLERTANPDIDLYSMVGKKKYGKLATLTTGNLPIEYPLALLLKSVSFTTHLVDSLLMMHQAERLMDAGCGSELVDIMKMAPVGQRLTFKSKNRLAIIDMQKHQNQHWYGVKYGRKSQVASAFILSPHHLDDLVTYLSSEDRIHFKNLPGVKVRSLKPAWYQGGDSITQIILAFAGDLGDKLAMALLLDFARTVVKVGKIKHFDWQSLVSQLSSSSAQSLLSAILALPRPTDLDLWGDLIKAISAKV